jgi:hypothetical protein
MEYTMDYVAEVNPLDEVVEQDGARVLIAPMAQMFLIGTEIDYEVGPAGSGFVFRNPNVAEACGCGESIKFKRHPRRPDGRAHPCAKSPAPIRRRQPARDPCDPWRDCAAGQARLGRKRTTKRGAQMKKLAAGNWKMNGTAAALAEVKALIDAHPDPACEMLLCPPATLIAQMAWAARGIGPEDRRAGLPHAGLGRPYRRHLGRDAGRCRRKPCDPGPFRTPRRPWRDRRAGARQGRGRTAAGLSP